MVYHDILLVELKMWLLKTPALNPQILLSKEPQQNLNLICKLVWFISHPGTSISYFRDTQGSTLKNKDEVAEEVTDPTTVNLSSNDPTEETAISNDTTQESTEKAAAEEWVISYAF